MTSGKRGVCRAAEVALVLLLALHPLQLAHAQQTDESAVARAKALYQRAERFYFIGEFKRALDLYNEAFKTKPLPGFLFNIGQCQRKLGDCERAVFNFKQYLLHQPSAPNRGVVEQLIELCQAKLASDAEERQRSTAMATPKPEPPVAPPADSRRLSPVWFWTAAGLAVALLATGAVTGAVALDKSAEYKDPETPISRRLELLDEAEPFRPLSTVSFIAGGVAAVGAGVLFYLTWLRGEREPTQAPPPVSAGLLPGGGAVFLQGNF